MTEPESNQQLALAQDVVERARRAGADHAEVSVGEGWDLTVKVRLGQPELVEEAGHRGLALRVIRDSRVAVTSTSDLSPAGLSRCIEDAVMLARLSEPDPCAEPVAGALLAQPPFVDLDLFDPSVSAIDADQALELATRGEQAALAFDSRIALSEGASFSRATGNSTLVLSSGFAAQRRRSHASLVVTPVAKDEQHKNRRGHYWTARRHAADLESPEDVGMEAARRTVARLGSRPVQTCQVPVVFDHGVAKSLLSSFAGCLLGGALWRKSSYLLDRLGTLVANPSLTIVDDPLMPRAFGSREFDGEGLPTSQRTVVEAGVLKSFLLDTYSARKLGLESTASSSRHGGSLAASTSNLLLAPGERSLDDLLGDLSEGLYVTEMMGFGFNPVTGDFSRGASGFWIRNGERAFPVSEITVSANIDTLMKDIDAIANDLDLRTSVASPSFRVRKMTVSGK